MAEGSKWVVLPSLADACEHLRSIPRAAAPRGIFSKLFSNAPTHIPAIVVGPGGAGKRTLLASLARIDPAAELADESDPVAVDIPFQKSLFRCVVFPSPASGEEGAYSHLRGVVDALGTEPIEPRPALIFVCDASRIREPAADGKEDANESPLFREFLRGVRTSPALAHAALLLFANKQDDLSAASVAGCADALNLHALRYRSWYIQATDATSGDGVREGFDWLEMTLRGSLTQKDDVQDVQEEFSWPEMGGAMTKSAAKR
jgi:ADP-ribosylation factor family